MAPDRSLEDFVAVAFVLARVAIIFAPALCLVFAGERVLEAAMAAQEEAAAEDE
jgi:hypothetical protein